MMNSPLGTWTMFSGAEELHPVNMASAERSARHLYAAVSISITSWLGWIGQALPKKNFYPGYPVVNK